MSDIGALAAPTPPFHTNASELDEEANKPSDLFARMRAEAERVQAEPKRGPGRPRGSRNEPRIVRPNTGSTRTTPNDREPTEAEKLAAAARARELKQARVVELTGKVADTINDNLVLLLSSMGMPKQLLYKPGMEPKDVEDNSRYTPFVGQVLVSPMQASIYARFIAEAENTPIGQKVAGVGGTGNGPLIVYGLLSLAATAQYLQGAQTFLKELKPMLDQYKVMADVAANQARSDIPQPQGYRE